MKTRILHTVRSVTAPGTLLGAVFLMSQAASGQLSIDAGIHDLAGNSPTTQFIDLYVVNSGSDQRVGSFDLYLQIGTGDAAAPIISSVDLLDGTPFSGNNSGFLSDTSNPQSVYYGVVKGAGAPGSGPLLGAGSTKIARIGIDTSGFGEGTLAFDLFGGPLGDTSFYSDETTPELVPLNLGNGFLNISSVPEPASLAVAVGVGLLGFGFWRRQRRA